MRIHHVVGGAAPGRGRSRARGRDRGARPSGVRRHAPRVHRPVPGHPDPQDRQQRPPQSTGTDRPDGRGAEHVTKAGPQTARNASGLLIGPCRYRRFSLTRTYPKTWEAVSRPDVPWHGDRLRMPSGAGFAWWSRQSRPAVPTNASATTSVTVARPRHASARGGRMFRT